MLDPNLPAPLYRQLADVISARIRAGEYSAGHRIPSEHELAAYYQVGRPTVRQATEFLVRKNLLERRRGSGTFVCERKPEIDLFSIHGTSASFEQGGYALETRATAKLRLRRVEADARNPFAGKRAYVFARLGSVARQPVLHEQIFLEPTVFPGLDQRSYRDGSMSQLVEQHYQLSPVAGRQSFTAEPASAKLCKVFRIEPAAPMLVVRRTLDFAGAEAAVFAVMVCHTERFAFAENIGDLSYA
tara:strand:+ start:117 stop:848 length:732 start_codon:yes stop_codon:yes gene_type:complete